VTPTLQRLALLALLVPAALAAPFDARTRAHGQDRQPETPRFRAGANLVRVDAYVSKDDVPLIDLKAEDFVVYEDDKPQTLENVALIQARAPNPQTERSNPLNVRDMQQQTTEAARVFTLYFDNLRVSLPGSYRAQKPIVDMLDRVIGPDDLIGVMTPQMSPSSVTYSRRTSSLERIVTGTWQWGKRDSVLPQSLQEDTLRACYGEKVALPFILRLREEETLESIAALIRHLDTVRPERKFVVMFTEGWPLFRPQPRLLELLPRDPQQEPPGTDPRTGALRKPGAIESQPGVPSPATCQREATRLAYVDHEFVFRELLQRANRANVSFYPIDARGLVVFDMPIEWGIPPSVDAAWLSNRYSTLRLMAEQTDGGVVLDTNDVSGAMRKMFADLGSYYLLGYYSTNSRLDGRFRRIRVEVKRPGVSIRARPGYLAPTEADARAAVAMVERAGAKPALPPTVARALDSLAPARGQMPARIQAAGGPGFIGAIVEIDSVTLKQQEWANGGALRVSFEAEGRAGTAVQTVNAAFDPGQRSVIVDVPAETLGAGKYVVRAELTPRGARSGTQVSTPVEVVPADAPIGSSALAYRRGPSTGLAYMPTADARFRRTERLRIEVPIHSNGIAATGRLLTRDGQPLPLAVTYRPRRDETSGRSFGQAEVILSPLAAGEFVLELTFTTGGLHHPVAYGFRIVP
jgi:VWFA-related protein